MIHLYIYHFKDHIPDLVSRSGSLPLVLRRHILSKKQKRKRETSLLGYLLLQKALRKDFDTGIEHITILKSGKPVLKNRKIHFSISHSGNTIGVVVSKQGAIGLDIQQFREFKTIEASFAFFTKSEQEAILASELPNRKLIEFWSKKEALVKAAGGQMFKMSAHADISSSSSTWSGCTYFFYPLSIKFNGYAWLASSFPANKILTTNILSV
ncbi:4'-phosphopantetheinyl transferase superfamily protein [Aureispira]|nr:4'-phosphopantetheinyl transferase superfamily protein [Aureispira sp.]